MGVVWRGLRTTISSKMRYVKIQYSRQYGNKLVSIRGGGLAGNVNSGQCGGEAEMCWAWQGDCLRTTISSKKR